MNHPPSHPQVRPLYKVEFTAEPIQNGRLCFHSWQITSTRDGSIVYLSQTFLSLIECQDNLKLLVNLLCSKGAIEGLVD